MLWQKPQCNQPGLPLVEILNFASARAQSHQHEYKRQIASRQRLPDSRLTRTWQAAEHYKHTISIVVLRAL